MNNIFSMSHVICGAFQGGACGKESACQCKRCKRQGFYPWVWKISWSRKQKPTPAFLPGKFHGQRSLVGYSPWGCKESDTTEWLSMPKTEKRKAAPAHIPARGTRCTWAESATADPQTQHRTATSAGKTGRVTPFKGAIKWCVIISLDKKSFFL